VNCQAWIDGILKQEAKVHGTLRVKRQHLVVVVVVVAYYSCEGWFGPDCHRRLVPEVLDLLIWSLSVHVSFQLDRRAKADLLLCLLLALCVIHC
jgi:hypothetical protein